jgi:hypothetical protein
MFRYRYARWHTRWPLARVVGSIGSSGWHDKGCMAAQSAVAGAVRFPQRCQALSGRLATRPLGPLHEGWRSAVLLLHMYTLHVRLGCYSHALSGLGRSRTSLRAGSTPSSWGQGTKLMPSRGRMPGWLVLEMGLGTSPTWPIIRTRTLARGCVFIVLPVL